MCQYVAPLCSLPASRYCTSTISWWSCRSCRCVHATARKQIVMGHRNRSFNRQLWGKQIVLVCLRHCVWADRDRVQEYVLQSSTAGKADCAGMSTPLLVSRGLLRTRKQASARPRRIPWEQAKGSERCCAEASASSRDSRYSARASKGSKNFGGSPSLALAS